MRRAVLFLIRKSNLSAHPLLWSLLLWVSRVVIFLLGLHIILSVFLSEESVFLDLIEGIVLLSIIIATPCWLWLFLDWIYRKGKLLGKV